VNFLERPHQQHEAPEPDCLEKDEAFQEAAVQGLPQEQREFARKDRSEGEGRGIGVNFVEIVDVGVCGVRLRVQIIGDAGGEVQDEQAERLK